MSLSDIARGGKRENAGRPPNEGSTLSKVIVYLGRDEAARQVKSRLEEIKSQLNHAYLRDTVQFLISNWRDKDKSKAVADAFTNTELTVSHATSESVPRQDISISTRPITPQTRVSSQVGDIDDSDCQPPSTKKGKISSENTIQVLKNFLLSKTAAAEARVCSTPLTDASIPSLASSFIVGSDVSPLSLNSESELPLCTSTPASIPMCTQGEGLNLGDVTIESTLDGNILVDPGDGILNNEELCDDEETMIQSIIEDCEKSEPSQYYSSKDPYFTIVQGNLCEEVQLVNDKKCIVFINQLKELLGKKCRVVGCSEDIVVNVVDCGYCCKLQWECKNKHSDHWYSSPTHSAGFAINHIVHAAILFSGLNEFPFLRFCTFVGLMHTQQSTFYRYQKLYGAPTVNQEYEVIRSRYIKELRGFSEVVVYGDGRMDSPGFSAVKGTYSLLDNTGRIVTMEHGDKRQVNLKSTNLEPHLFKKVLSSLLEEGIPIKEVVTDANVQIISILKKVDAYKGIFHSLDVWHKAAKLTAKLSEAAKKKNCKILGEWVSAIRNHFWFICRECGGDEQRIRELWVSIIHHCCDSHKWAQGECLHAPMSTPGDGKSWISPESPAADALRDVVFDKRWLNTLPYYVRNRHTGKLESFHNLMLAYASKRVGFKHDGYVARMQLAFLDYNYHLNRPQMKTKSGKLVYTRKWSKRTGKWHDVPIPVKKTYDYIPELIAKSMYRKHLDKSSIRETGTKSKVAKTLFTNVSNLPAPPTDQLVAEHVNRLSMNQAEI